jgi:hypothetical protein
VSAVNEPAVFQVIYPGDPLQADLLALWQPAALEKIILIGGEQPGVVWRADLPDDPAASARLLTTHALSLQQTNVALDVAGPLLQQDIRRASSRAAAPGQVDFGVSPTQDSASAANGRYDLIAQALNADPHSVAFGLSDEVTEAAEIVSRFAGSVHRLVDQFALVESSRGGNPSARTRVDWLGDVQTWWLAGSPAPAIADHRRVLAQAIATRQAWLRLAATLTAGAAKVGLSMAAGPFNPVAILTVWKYVQKVIEQYRAIRIGVPVEQES